ncbi:MAG: Rne/Rng family ribonuclease [Betaproteobacteria bacterium]|nr:Rne/Rng family ribonuclease [Betaproteobacteria bacterium]
MKRMLFNATQAEELRVAIVDGQKLVDLDIETAGKEQRKGNVYKGVITRVEPSLEAAFVDYGSERHGFLPFKEVTRAYFKNPDADPARARIQDVLSEGQEFIVQVEKDERGTKGAALTTFVSLAGRYLVLMPNNPRGGGVSRRVEGEERNELKDLIAQLDVPQGASIIGRTAGLGCSLEELNWDLAYLLQLWRAIENAASFLPSPNGDRLIYQESSLVIRAIRDYFQQDIGELLIDTENIYEQARQFMSHVMPNNVSRVKLYRDDVPLFSRFQIEHQIETAYARQVALPAGGSIVIDHTEALVSVDVNSARATRGADIEHTALNTNLEACDEIARQLRLRDLGGLVVIDFIDMENPRNQRDVENRLRDALHFDRARVQMGKISRFGLMELSRQRLQTSLGETSHIACPRCHGIGHIRSIESSALHILRILQEEAMKENTAAVHAQVPVDVATYLLNEKRAEFHSIEQRLKVAVVLIPNIHLETPNYNVSRLRHDELNQMEPLPVSYRMVEQPTEKESGGPSAAEQKALKPQAAVQSITPEQPAPTNAEQVKPSIFKKIFGWLTRKPEEEKPAAAPKSRYHLRRQQEARRDRGKGRRPERDASEAAAGKQAAPARGEGERPQRTERPDRPDRAERGERKERPERQDRPERGERPPREDRPERGPRPERQGRGERPERQPRPERERNPERSPPPEMAEGAVSAEAVASAPRQRHDGEGDFEGRGPRRRRGGRDRGRGREGRPEAGSTAESIREPEQVSLDIHQSESSFTPAEAERTYEPSHHEEREVRTEAQAEVRVSEPVEFKPSPSLAPEHVAVRSSPPPRERAPVMEKPELPPGLELVETAREKAASVPEHYAAGSEDQPRRQRRPRHSDIPMEEHPMVQVETQSTRDSA